MKKILKWFGFILVILILYFQNNRIESQDNNKGDVITADTIIPPVISIKPSEMRASTSEGNFITREVKVLNRGGSLLIIKKVTGSCQCATASIQNSYVEPLSVGKLILSINTKGLYDDKNIVEYYVESNAKNSPTSIRIIIDKQVQDSTEKQ